MNLCLTSLGKPLRDHFFLVGSSLGSSLSWSHIILSSVCFSVFLCKSLVLTCYFISVYMCMETLLQKIKNHTSTKKKNLAPFRMITKDKSRTQNKNIHQSSTTYYNNLLVKCLSYVVLLETSRCIIHTRNKNVFQKKKTKKKRL